MKEFKGTIGVFLDGTTGWKVKTNEQHWNNKDIQSHEIIWSDDEECVVDHVYDLQDAKLISASPELFYALKNILDQLENEHVSEYMEEFVNNAKLAIDKAL